MFCQLPFSMACSQAFKDAYKNRNSPVYFHFSGVCIHIFTAYHLYFTLFSKHILCLLGDISKTFTNINPRLISTTIHYGLNCITHKAMLKSQPPESVDVTLFGKKYFADIIELR